MTAAARFRRYAARIETLEARIAPALLTTLSWQGDVNNQWGGGTAGTNTNWISVAAPNSLPKDGVVLSFPSGAAQKTNVNNLTGLDLRSLAFGDVGYDITGNAVTLSSGVAANLTAAGNNEFHPTITLAANQTFTYSSTGNSVLALDTVDLAGKTLTVDGTATIRFGTLSGTKLTGAGAVIKNGTGGLAIGDGNDFTGPVTVNAGTLGVANDGLGATGPGNGTAVASGASLSLPGNTTAEDFTISGNGTAGQTGAISAGLANNTLSGAIRLGANATIAQAPTSGGSLTLTGAIGAADDALAILTVQMGNAANNFALAAATTLTMELAGTTPGAGGHDQLKVVGSINLAGATLNVVPSFTPQVGDKFTLVENDAIEDVVGTFAGLAQGATITAGGVNFKIAYNGGDGNDVVLTVDSLTSVPIPITLSADGKTATFLDVDGDQVTVKTNKGPFLRSDFVGVATDLSSTGQLQQLNLTTRPNDFKGASLTITAKPGPLGGNGLVNVGYVNATGIDLGVVKIGGDLGRIAAGTVGGEVKVPAIKSLSVESLGLLGTSTQANGGTVTSAIAGALPKLVVQGDVRGDILLDSIGDGRLGSAKIGGTVQPLAGSSVTLFAAAGIGSLTVGGDIRSGDFSVLVDAGVGALGLLSVGGSVVGSAAQPVRINVFGQLAEPAGGLDLALATMKVGGSVESLLLVAGNAGSGNADAAIGSISVGGDWIGSSVIAGAFAGTDGKFGTADDVKNSGARDNADLFSTISSFTVKGQALGTATSTTDMFGMVAERIGKAKVGGRTFAFTKGATPEAFFAAPTGIGAGAENPAFDFTIRELGSTTPTPTFGGPNLTVSADGRIATFTDVDGDLVTVKRSAGTFVAGDFTIATVASGGGQLQSLALTAAPGDGFFDLSITAKPGAEGGNGLVNVGQVTHSPTAKVGTSTVAGDLGGYFALGSDGSEPHLRSLSVHSLGRLGTTTGTTGLLVNVQGPLPKFTVAADVHEMEIRVFGNNANLGKLTLGGSFDGSAAQGIGPINIGGTLGELNIRGSFQSGNAAGSGAITAGTIGRLSIGGDLVGSVAVPVEVKAFGQSTVPTAGLDVAIQSVTVKGGVENTRILAGGTTNADAAIGAISVGRAWLGSSVLAGVQAGTDTVFGTSDDTKVTTAPLRDVATRFSTIASITIKGQALGTATSTTDMFGIVAERIGKAKVGGRTFAFTKGATPEAFFAAPTLPGAGAENPAFDFTIRELGSTTPAFGGPI